MLHSAAAKTNKPRACSQRTQSAICAHTRTHAHAGIIIVSSGKCRRRILNKAFSGSVREKVIISIMSCSPESKRPEDPLNS